MARVTLDLDRKDISVEHFTEMFSAQIRLVRQIMLEMGLPANDVRWVVAGLQYGSAVAEAEPQVIGESAFMADIDLAVSATGIGMRALERSPTRPKYFSDEALKTTRRLSQLVTEANAGNARLRFGSEIVTPSSMLVAHVDSLVKGNLPSIGSIDGKLISVSGENGSYTIHIHDRLRGRRVRCSIPEDVLPRALRAFESRIIARGIIWSRSDGSAVRIDLRDFDIVPPEESLPKAQEVRGILGGYQRADGD